MLGLFTEMSTATVSMWLNEWGVIDPDSLSDRKQPTLPLLCEHHREEPLKEGTGWEWRLGCCLIGSCNSGGLVVMLRLCPLKHKQEGPQRAAPGPGSRRWPLWPIIMGSVALSYPQHIIRAKHHQGRPGVCSFVYIFTSWVHMRVFLRKSSMLGKKGCSSKSAWKGSTRVVIHEDVLAQKSLE